ncbi:MAG: elongation factor G [Candidatus Dormibacteria bacterium]
MTKFAPAMLRNVAILGHSHEGKTSLAEAMLFTAGAIDRLGKADAGTTTLDFEPEEQKRKISINLSCAGLTWNGFKVNLLDAPGFFDFATDCHYALSAADAALVVATAQPALAVGTEVAWQQAEGRPRVLVINKMDKENADFAGALAAAQAQLTPKPVAIQVPIGSEASFRGVVDILANRAVLQDEAGKATHGPVPEDLVALVSSYRAALTEAAAESDDALLEKYLDQGELTEEEIIRGVHLGVAAGTLIPAVCCSAAKSVGIAALLDTVTRLCPSPFEGHEFRVRQGEAEPVALEGAETGPTLAYVFKTTTDPFLGHVNYFRVLRGTLHTDEMLVNARSGAEEKLQRIGHPKGKAIEETSEIGAGDIGVAARLHAATGDTLAARGSVLTVVGPDLPEPGYIRAVDPTNKADEAKIGQALHSLLEEDAGLRTSHDDITKQTLIHGFGDVQLDVAMEKLKRKYQVEAVLHEPRIPFRESVTSVVKAEKKYKKQSGGAGMYGHCVIEIAPLGRGEGFAWEDKIFGGSIPQPLRPSVERGVRETMEEGVISGNPVVDVKVTLLDGSTHPVDGKDMAFRLAGAMAMKEAVQKANPVLLEPVMEVVVMVPERFMGDVMSDFTTRRGKVLGTDQVGRGMTEIRAHVPRAELNRYALDLRSMTQGRGHFRVAYDHQEEMPQHLSQPIVDAYQKEHAGKADDH